MKSGDARLSDHQRVMILTTNLDMEFWAKASFEMKWHHLMVLAQDEEEEIPGTVLQHFDGLAVVSNSEGPPKVVAIDRNPADLMVAMFDFDGHSRVKSRVALLGIDEWQSPEGVAAHDDRIVIVDSGANAVTFFDGRGVVVEQVGGNCGDGPQELDNPHGVCIGNNFVFV